MFTKNQIQEIGRKLCLFGKKDTDFDDAKLPLSGEEYVVLVQNGKNVKTKVKNLGGNFQPDDPNDPENPENPDDPSDPDIPDVPDEPDVPDTPDDPDVPTYDPPKLYVIPKTWNVESTGGTLEVHLDPRNADTSTLRAINVADDIKCERLSTTRIFNVTMPENKTSNIRYETITFSVVGLDGTTAEATLNIEQEAAENKEEEITTSITFEPSTLIFNYNEANVTKEFIGTFVNCAPISGVSDNDVVIEYIETLGGGKYKFTAKVLKSNNSSKNITYTGRIQYKDTLGYTAYKTIPIIVNKAPSATITITPSNLKEVPYIGGSYTIAVVAKNSIDDNVLSGAVPYDWITIKKVALNTFNVTIAENPYNKQRTANAQFYVTGLDGIEKGATLQISQLANPNVTEDDETPMIYRGYLNADLVNEFALGASGVSKIYENVTADVLNRGVEMGIIVKEPLEEKGKTAFFDTPKGTISIFAIPHSSTMNVYKDNGFNAAVPFNHDQLNVNGETVTMIGNEAYRLYGEYEPDNIGVGDQSVKKYYYIK